MRVIVLFLIGVCIGYFATKTLETPSVQEQIKTYVHQMIGE